MSSTLTLRLPAAQRQALKRRAAALKKTEAGLLRELVERETSAPSPALPGEKWPGLLPKRSPGAARGAASLVRKGKLLVATGYPPGTDIAAAMEAERAEREAELAAPLLIRKGSRP